MLHAKIKYQLIGLRIVNLFYENSSRTTELSYRQFLMQIPARLLKAFNGLRHKVQTLLCFQNYVSVAIPPATF